MCQSHMEAPAVAGTMVGTETREEIGALWSGVYRFRFGEKTEDGDGSGPGTWNVAGSGTWKGPRRDWEWSWMWSLCLG